MKTHPLLERAGRQNRVLRGREKVERITGEEEFGRA